MMDRGMPGPDMTDEAGRRRRRDNLLILAGSVIAVVALIGALGLLVPPPAADPAAPRTRPEAVSCERPGSGAAAVQATSGVLLTCPEVFDGRQVVILGEAIGDLLRGPGGRRWVQVNDDAYADAGPLGTHGQTLGTNSGIAVLLPSGRVPSSLGGPGAQGDRLEVRGTFRAASAEDQGGPAVIADVSTVVQQGGPVDTPAWQRVRIAAAVMAVVAAALLTAVWRRRSPLGTMPRRRPDTEH